MEIRITTGTYNTSNFRVVKDYKNMKSAVKFIASLGYDSGIFSGLQFSKNGIQYTVYIQD